MKPMPEPGTMTDADLAAIERRWTVTAAVVLCLVLCGAALALLLVPLYSQPLGGVEPSAGWPPFNHKYNSLESLVLYWWPIAVPALVVVSLIAIRILRLANGLIAVGLCVLLVALALAVR